jgi:SagB-type dehydrogenase family enzyme
MDHIRLKSPFLRIPERTPREFSYRCEKVIYLHNPEKNHKDDFFHIIERRKSRRDGVTLCEEDVSSLLWFCSRTKQTTREASGFLWQHRPVPSAGGRHPIDIILYNYMGDTSSVYLYDPFSHSLFRLKDIDNTALMKFRTAVNDVLAIENATILWFLGQFDKTLSKYENGECLVWLDAGILLGTVYLVAEALALGCCAVGITGEPWVSEALNGNGQIDGLTGCLVWK